MSKRNSSQTLPSHFGLVSRRDFLKFCGVAAAAMGLIRVPGAGGRTAGGGKQTRKPALPESSAIIPTRQT